MGGNKKQAPRFEWLLKRVYVQDAHKPWSGHIQGQYFVGAPEELRLRQLELAEPFDKGRPLGVEPYPPYRRPWGSETNAMPIYDTGYDYPPENFVPDPSLELPPVGVNEMPMYYRAEDVEGEAWSEYPVDLEQDLRPDPWSPNWLKHSAPSWLDGLVNWFKGLFGMRVEPPTTDSTDSTSTQDEKPASSTSGSSNGGSGTATQTTVTTTGPMHAPNGIPIRPDQTYREPAAPLAALVTAAANRYKQFMGAGKVNKFSAPKVQKGILNIPPMVPDPTKPFWGNGVDESSGIFWGRTNGQFYTPNQVYSVTKVIDNVIQDNYEESFPDAHEATAYDPDGAGMTPYGIYMPTISKFSGLKKNEAPRKPKCKWPTHACKKWGRWSCCGPFGRWGF